MAHSLTYVDRPAPSAVPVRLVDRAYESLRDALISLRIEPGEPMDEKQLSASMGVGLTPVRDALKRLTLEGLVVIYPRRGTFAAEIRVSDELWLTEVRIPLEGQAAALAAQRATREDCQRLLTLTGRTGEEGGNPIDLDVAIHRAVYAAAHNAYLETACNQHANLAMRLWNYAFRRDPSPCDVPCTLDSVVHAIAARDPERAQHEAEVHLRQFSDEVRDLLSR
ncbi:DNA-binding transcriptional regulator, GntR family [Geodermatophilus telluris]|uniref:DNA-binding transcriptional regulator, GntR family n=1 Tax=Geodermatophilus telluris TaxID=1190417 RepID=A0A1G6QKV7_9ACTN|nr:GntR family transcriptional regulator [Geodermatophilus telluris]SDC93060.1 DNA-binding transcriptional regulator, GntR family [Geodermatophilus telluris]